MPGSPDVSRLLARWRVLALAAYVFTGSGGTWTQQAKLTGAHGAANDFFGHAVTLSGTTAVAGSYGKNSVTGAAYVFVKVQRYQGGEAGFRAGGFRRNPG
jgi:FG-GAP repeat